MRKVQAGWEELSVFTKGVGLAQLPHPFQLENFYQTL